MNIHNWNIYIYMCVCICMREGGREGERRGDGGPITLLWDIKLYNFHREKERQSILGLFVPIGFLPNPVINPGQSTKL